MWNIQLTKADKRCCRELTVTMECLVAITSAVCLSFISTASSLTRKSPHSATSRVSF